MMDNQLSDWRCFCNEEICDLMEANEVIAASLEIVLAVKNGMECLLTFFKHTDQIS